MCTGLHHFWYATLQVNANHMVNYILCYVSRHPLPGDVMSTPMTSHRACECDVKLSRCYREKCQSSSPRDVATQFAGFESGISFKRRSTIRRSLMWRTRKNICWGSGDCWTTPSSWQWLHSDIWVQTFEHKFWTNDFLVCFVRFINTVFRKVDGYSVLILHRMCYFCVCCHRRVQSGSNWSALVWPGSIHVWLCRQVAGFPRHQPQSMSSFSWQWCEFDR